MGKTFGEPWSGQTENIRIRLVVVETEKKPNSSLFRSKSKPVLTIFPAKRHKGLSVEKRIERDREELLNLLDESTLVVREQSLPS